MNNNKLIAQALLDIAKNSETTFLEVAKEDKELIEAAKKLGIELPSPDLMVMKTVYAEIDKVNLNGVILPKKAVEEGLKTLVGKQCNWEHDGAGFICGYTISAKINKDKIETINVLFKSLFIDQADELIEKVKSGEAAVSFEIWNKDPETGKSVVKELDNGFKEISPIIFHGTGVLLTHKPACPTAKIFKLVAQNLAEVAEKVMHRIFEQDLVYAQLAIENNEKEENKMDLLKLFENVKIETDITMELALAFYYASEEEQKTLTEDAAKWTRKFINDLPDSAFAVIEPAYPEKIEDKNCRHLPHHNGEGDLGKEKSNTNLDLPHYKNALARCNQINPVSDSISAEDLRGKANAHLERHKDALEKSSEEFKTEVKTEETKPVDAGAETKSVETEVKETKEVVVETNPEVKTEVAQPLEVIEPKIIVKITRSYTDIFVDTYVDGTSSGTSQGKSTAKTITEYKDGTQDVVETESEYKKKFDLAEVEEKVNTAKSEKDAEIATLKAEQERILAEKDKEITQSKQELATKEQEIAELKNPKVDIKKEKEMTVGAVETETKSELKIRAEKINEIIANKGK
jgi:hypothetical protein